MGVPGRCLNDVRFVVTLILGRTQRNGLLHARREAEGRPVPGSMFREVRVLGLGPFRILCNTPLFSLVLHLSRGIAGHRIPHGIQVSSTQDYHDKSIESDTCLLRTSRGQT